MKSALLDELLSLMSHAENKGWAQSPYGRQPQLALCDSGVM